MNLLVEKYRPKNLNELILDENVRIKIQSYIDSDEIPHLLFYGKSGVGKTSTSKVITNSIDCDCLYINSSDENNIEIVRTKIKDFVINIGFHKWKVVLLDECDNMTQSSMGMLRNLMEQYSSNSRFILTCNYIDRIIEPITSRCQLIHLLPSSYHSIQKRIEYILHNEGTEFSQDDITKVVEHNYPDIRRMLNYIEYQTNNGVFVFNRTNNMMSVGDKIVGVLTSPMSKREKLDLVRLILDESEGQNFQNLYSFLFNHIDEYGSNKVGQILLILDEGQYRLSHSVDRKLNFLSTIVEIINIL